MIKNQKPIVVSVGVSPSWLSPSWPEIGFGFFMLAFAAFVAYGASLIPPSLYDKVGPEKVAWFLAIVLSICAFFLIARGLRGGWKAEDEEEGASDYKLDKFALLWLGVGLIANLVLMDGVVVNGVRLIPDCGFIVASTVLFTCVARGFGSKIWWRDALIGFVMASFSYIGFDRILGYQIGSGWVETWIKLIF